jgi:cytidylate kinase
MHTVIGLSGTNGSGKDTIGEVLAEHHGYLFVSVSDLLRDELRRRGLAVTRENLRTLSAEWRRESGLGVLIDKAKELFDQEPGTYKGLVMASLRNPGEVKRVHHYGGIVVWVDADPHIRYERIQRNAHLRDRAGEDVKTFEEFLAEEKAEMEHSGDEATLNMAGVRDTADLTLINNHLNIEAFKKDIDAALIASA